MLVLTGHCGEQIAITDDVVVTVVAIEGNKIRLGIEAPKSIPVDRKEVHDRRVFERDDGWSIMNEIDTGCPVG
jgi:carbon storage regulator